jgi:hypothetical protein
VNAFRKIEQIYNLNLYIMLNFQKQKKKKKKKKKKNSKRIKNNFEINKFQNIGWKLFEICDNHG